MCKLITMAHVDYCAELVVWSSVLLLTQIRVGSA